MQNQEESQSTFTFALNVTGLVMWYRKSAKAHDNENLKKGHFLAVRTRTGLGEHVARLLYPIGNLYDATGKKIAAPDPLVATPTGEVVASRELSEEILRLKPVFADNESHTLTETIDGLLEVGDLDCRICGIDPRCFQKDISKSPAIGRLDVEHGQVTAKSESGDWKVVCPHSDSKRFKSVATVLRLTLSNLKRLTLVSNGKDLFDFRSPDKEKTLEASFTVEPETDHVTDDDDPFPHFAKHFHLARWKNNDKPDDYCRLRPTARAKKKPQPMETVSDKACPPSGGGG